MAGEGERNLQEVYEVETSKKCPAIIDLTIPTKIFKEREISITADTLVEKLVVKISEINCELKDLGWHHRLSTIFLLVPVSATIYFSLMVVLLGTNLTFLLVGFLIAILSSIFIWKRQIRMYDNLIRQPPTENSKIVTILIIAILIVLTYSVNFFISIIVGPKLAEQATFSFYGGFQVFWWLSYYRLIYWEKKNNITIYLVKRYGTLKKSYIIQERK